MACYDIRTGIKKDGHQEESRAWIGSVQQFIMNGVVAVVAIVGVGIVLSVVICNLNEIWCALLFSKTKDPWRCYHI